MYIISKEKHKTQKKSKKKCIEECEGRTEVRMCEFREKIKMDLTKIQES